MGLNIPPMKYINFVVKGALEGGGVEEPISDGDEFGFV